MHPQRTTDPVLFNYLVEGTTGMFRKFAADSKLRKIVNFFFLDAFQPLCGESVVHPLDSLFFTRDLKLPSVYWSKNILLL